MKPGTSDLVADCDLLVVGAGFYGATVAESAARVLGKRVLVIDARDHVAGNAHTEIDASTGIEVHRYGAHLFHTSNPAIWAYVNRFSAFIDYRHRVFTCAGGRVYPMPINLATICQYFERRLSPDQARALIEAQAAELAGTTPDNLEDKAISLIGRPLYEAFIRGYTQKQWQTDPRDLPADIINRLPIRYSFDDRYFSDLHQGLPVNGYTALIERMLSHPRIAVRTGVDFFALKPRLRRDLPVVYTGPIDRYFDYAEGVLGWRTVKFDQQVLDVGDFQGTGVMNYADADVPWTRILEFRHFNPDRVRQTEKTVIAHEYSYAAGRRDDPYYPIATRADKALHARYKARAAAERNVHFGGRLGTYRYLDMHQAIGAAQKAFDQILVPHFRDGTPLSGHAPAVRLQMDAAE